MAVLQRFVFWQSLQIPVGIEAFREVEMLTLDVNSRAAESPGLHIRASARGVAEFFPKCTTPSNTGGGYTSGGDFATRYHDSPIAPCTLRHS